MRASLLALGRKRWLACGIAIGALAAGSAAYAATVTIDGTILHGGDTTTWDPQYDSYACTPPPGAEYPFLPFYYGGTATKQYPFVGGFALFVGGINADPFFDADGKGTLSGRSLAVGPTNMGSLTVSERESALDTPTVRVLVKFHNNTAQVLHKTIAVESKVGYDPAQIDATSTGDTQWTQKDRWVVTHDPEDNTYAPSTQVWYGKNANTKVRTTDHTNGDHTCFLSNFLLNVPANGTVYLMFFAEANKFNVGQAIHSAAKFDQTPLKKKLTTGLSPAVKKQIVNWDL